MWRKKLTEKQINELLTSTPLFESEGEEFDCDSDEDWKLPLTEDSSDGSDQDSTVNEEETRETDNILCNTQEPQSKRSSDRDSAVNDEDTRETDNLPCSNQKPLSKRKRIEETSSPLVYHGKDGTVWTLDTGEEALVGRRNTHNVMKDTPGPTSFAKRNITEGNNISALNLFIDSYIIDHIVKCTETEARLKLNTQDWKTSKEEIYQLIGIMYARGLLAKGQPVDQIWSKKWGIKYFSDTMSRNRYKELLRFIRFDIRSTRSERLTSDKFALFSTVWNRFIENCKANYMPNANITIDEQLFPTKGRCPFTQYMANKPDKFGVKFWLAVDSSSKYLVNGFPYLGKDAHRPSNQSLSEFVVLQLMDPFLGKGRNVTTDNFFHLGQISRTTREKENKYNRHNESHTERNPPEIKTCKAPLHSTKILKNNNMTLTVYQGKTNKNVLLLSTVHKNVSVSEEGKKFPIL
ncbi:piggyBac transposable element-derived protein 4-like [Macrobrachium rosenbergii]|uniref:piggyBac transposable element-derived protein 4-like n=1 Tax=Macrobrachium rosenbergii TaxID=79674 RepID=UPI0034D3EC28